MSSFQIVSSNIGSGIFPQQRQEHVPKPNLKPKPKPNPNLT